MATTDDIDDDDGVPSTFTYQWVRVDADGSSNEMNVGTNSSYTLAAADAGKKIRVKVSFTDGEGTDEEVVSDAYPPYANVMAAKGTCPTGNDWCGTLTLGEDADTFPTFVSQEIGYIPIHSLGGVDPLMFTHGGTAYTVAGVALTKHTTLATKQITRADLTFSVDGGDLPDGTVLNVGGETFTVDADSEASGVGQESWDLLELGTSLNWAEGGEVTVSLNLPPGLSTATVEGTSLVLTYSEDLDTGSVPATSAWSVKVDGGAGAAPSSVSVSGKAVTLTLASAVTGGQAVTVSYTVPGSNPVQDESGLAAAALTDRSVTNLTGNNATGAPTISGAPQVGMTLTAGLGDIADGDGLPTTTFPNDYTFQWLRGGNEISGATNSTYVPGTADVTQAIKVRVSFTDGASNTESRTSDATYAVMPAADTSTCVTGVDPWCATLTVGWHTLDLDDLNSVGFIAGGTGYGSLDDTTFRHNGVDYTVTVLAAAGITAAYFATDPNLPADGAGLTLHLQNVQGERALPLSEFTFHSTDNYWRLVGGTLTSKTDNEPATDVSLLRRFSRDDVLPADTDIGTEVAVRLSAVATGAATGAPTISGTVEVGETLTVDTSGISDPDGLTNVSYSYQWYRVEGGTETAIPGARGSSYTLVAADEDKSFRVKVTFTDDAGNPEELISSLYSSGVEGALRLEGGQNEDEGRLEIHHDGQWGTICDDRFDNPDNIAPQFACKLMGYATGEVLIGGGVSKAPSSMPIWLDDLRCIEGSTHWTGDPPTELSHCYNAGWGLNNCSHDEDVALRCTNVGGQGQEDEDDTGPLTASFENAPSTHGGAGSSFTLRIAFSTDVEITPADFKDDGITVSGATLSDVAQVDGRADLWELTIEPSGDSPVSILVPLGRACTEAGALCTADGRTLSTGLAQTILGPQPLTATFQDIPSEHDGTNGFWMQIRFSAPLHISFRALRDHALSATGGAVERARRIDGDSALWEIFVQPAGSGPVTVSLASSGACGSAGAICTADDRALANTPSTTIQGPQAPVALTASFANVPSEHDGTTAFWMQIEFSAPIQHQLPELARPRAIGNRGQCDAGTADRREQRAVGDPGAAVGERCGDGDAAGVGSVR